MGKYLQNSNGNITRLLRRGLVDTMHGGFGLVDNLYMTYNGNLLAGSLTSDAGRRIARIDYDMMNNPIRIQFTNGNVTRYVYSVAGEKVKNK